MKSLKFATQQNHDHKFLLVKFLHFCVFQSPERRWNLSLPKWLLNLSTYPHYMCVSVTQLCPTLCDPMDCSPPGSVHGILQARILQWLAVPFSRESSWPRDRTWSPALQTDSLLPEPPGTESIIWRVYKNTISWTPLPKFLTQWIWDGSQESEFLESSWMMFMILSEDYHTLSFFICAIIVFTHLENFQPLFLQVFFLFFPFCSLVQGLQLHIY